MDSVTPIGPSFAFGYWRPWQDNANAFDSYLDYTRDVTLAKYGADTVGKYIAQASKQHVTAVEQMARGIGQGLGVLSHKMSAIDQSLGFLNRNMDMLLEQQRLGNVLLENIAELLRVPDSEKERQHRIEHGIRFLVNAQHDPDLYADALEFLLQAESLMKQDYFVLHRIGCIYLYAEKHIDPEKALGYFLRAAKYASVDGDPKALRLANVLTQNSAAVNAEINSSREAVGMLAADAYEKAAFAAYVLGRFGDAVDCQTKALKWKTTAQYRFTLSKYQIRNQMTEEARDSLEKAIGDAPLLLAAVLRDIDFINEPWVVDFLARQKEAREVFRVLGAKDVIVANAIKQCVKAWGGIAKSSDGLYARIYTDYVEQLGQVLTGPSDEWVRASLDVLEEGLGYKPSNEYQDNGAFFCYQAHRLFSITKQRIEGYDAYVRAAYAGVGFGDSERALVQWIYPAKSSPLEADSFELGDSSSGSADKARLMVLVDALTLVAALDGRVGSREIQAIQSCAGSYGSEQEVLEQVRLSIRRIKDVGAKEIAKDVRDRLLQYRGTEFIDVVLRSQAEVANCDDVLHKDEARVIEWLSQQLRQE